MIEYSMFDKITIKLLKNKFERAILSEINKKGLNDKQKIEYCENLAEELEKNREKCLIEVENKMNLRDIKVKQWIDVYGGADTVAYEFPSGENAREENKAYKIALKKLLKSEGSILACKSIVEKIKNIQNKSIKR